MKKIITYLIFILLSGNIYSLEITVKGDSSKFDKEKTSLWFGWVEASRAYKGQYNETVIEFYCHKFELIKNKKSLSDSSLINVLPDSENPIHFVATIRTPNMSIIKAENFLKSMQPTKHFCYYPRAIVSFEGKFTDKKALFLAGDLTISNKFKVEVKK
jgi:hypothetical protein